MHKYNEDSTFELTAPAENTSVSQVVKRSKKKGAVLVFDAPVLPAEKIAAAAAHRAALDAQQIARVAARKKAADNAEKTGELIVHNLDLKPGQKEGDERAQKMRSKCLEVGKSLILRGNIRKELYKAGRKISNCRLMGLFQELTPTVNYKIGAALCKQRLCPNCQRVLSAKRKDNTLAWFDLNREKLRSFFFYHMVLTVPHDAELGLRTGVYTGEMLDSFAELRGTAKGMGVKKRKAVAGWWSSWIAGGFYYVEAKPGKDSPHIHIHCILLGKKQLWNAKQDSRFKAEAAERWAQITDNQTLMRGFFIEPVYYLDEEKKRVNCHFGSSFGLQSAVSEAAKYTMKTDTATLTQFSDDFLADMLTMKNRYYGRFGCLNAKDVNSKGFDKLELLRTDYKDLEQMTAREAARLFNPETGEIVNKADTRLVVTPFRNMRATETAGWVEPEREADEVLGVYLPAPPMKPAKERDAGERLQVGEMVYSFEQQVNYVMYYGPEERQTAIGRMGTSIGKEYWPALELDGVADLMKPRDAGRAAMLQKPENNFKNLNSPLVKGSKKQ